MKTAVLALIGLFFGISIVFIGTQASQPLAVRDAKPTLIPPANLKFFTLGYSEIVADSLWLRTIQDFDYCENRPAGAKNTDAICKEGWVYKMVNEVVELAPHFRQPHYFGPVMLTVVVNDVQGASKIFDIATERFPIDEQILFAAAYQALIEEKNLSKASILLIRAGKAGALPWVYALAGQLQMRSGQLRLAKTTLEGALATTEAGPVADRIQHRLDDVNAELAKQKQ
jgi:hypothetical protein